MDHLPPMDPEAEADLRKRNRRTVIGVGALVAGMGGLSFAAVPLYDLFCRVTGYGGTTQRGAALPATPGEARITVRFHSATHPNLPWRFQPEQGAMTLRVGEPGLAFYSAENLTDRPVTGISLYNVTPDKVGRYFHKIACFCFDEQTLEPRQRVDMPVSFWVDPRIAEDPNTRDVRTITLSYSFFRTLADAERAGALANAGPHVGRGGSSAPAARN